jgi:hypothetical protein
VVIARWFEAAIPGRNGYAALRHPFRPGANAGLGQPSVPAR